MKSLAVSAIAAKTAGIDDEEARYEIPMWKAALVSLEPMAQQIPDMRNRKSTLDDRVRNIKHDQMRLAEEDTS
eukprot:268318-Pyramimonas_sp.AAC.1